MPYCGDAFAESTVFVRGLARVVRLRTALGAVCTAGAFSVGMPLLRCSAAPLPSTLLRTLYRYTCLYLLLPDFFAAAVDISAACSLVLLSSGASDHLPLYCR